MIESIFGVQNSPSSEIQILFCIGMSGFVISAIVFCIIVALVHRKQNK